MKKNFSHGSKVGGGVSPNGPGKNEWLPPAPLEQVLAVQPLKSDLTPADKKEFEQLKNVVEKGWSTFLEVATALLTINRKKLYRDDYETFEAFCKERLGLSRPYAYSLIGCAEVNHQMSAIADIPVKPLTESQFRELIPVPEANRVEAWRGALKLAGDKPVTAKIIHQAAARFKKPKSGSPKKVAANPKAHSLKLQPAFDLIDDIQKLTSRYTSKPLAKQIAALRKFLKGLEAT